MPLFISYKEKQARRQFVQTVSKMSDGKFRSDLPFAKKTTKFTETD